MFQQVKAGFEMTPQDRWSPHKTGEHAIGAACVMNTVRRDWIDDQLSFLACLARIITEELTASRWHPQREPASQSGNTR